MKEGDLVRVLHHQVYGYESREGQVGELVHVTINGRFTTVRFPDGQEFYFMAANLEPQEKPLAETVEDCGEVYVLHKYMDAGVVVRVRAA